MNKKHVFDTIQARSIEIVCPDGKAVLRLSAESGSAQINLLNSQDGCSRICISLDGERANISLLNQEGITLAGIGADGHAGGILLSNLDEMHLVTLQSATQTSQVIQPATPR